MITLSLPHLGRNYLSALHHTRPGAATQGFPNGSWLPALPVTREFVPISADPKGCGPRSCTELFPVLGLSYRLHLYFRLTLSLSHFIAERNSGWGRAAQSPSDTGRRRGWGSGWKLLCCFLGFLSTVSVPRSGPEWTLSSSFGTHCDEADSFLTWQSYSMHPESLLFIGVLYGGLGSAASDPISLVRIELSWV